MSGLNGKVLARRERDELSFLVIGRVTCHHSPALRQYAEEGMQSGASSIEVDLRDCAYCDSTFLGTLLALKRRFDPAGKGNFRLLCPSASIRQMLTQIGAERLFCIADQAAAPDIQTTWQQLADTVDRAAARRFKQNVVDAHQELANAGGALAEHFASVAEAVSRELDAEREQRANQSAG
jgi:anti-anti-sigma factor